MNINIYRLLRKGDEKIEILKQEEEKYHLPKQIILTDAEFDLNSIQQHIIDTDKNEFALFCHDDVILPLDIEQKLSNAIENANQEFGEDNWGIVGNAGIKLFSEKEHQYVRFINDPHSKVIPPKSVHPIPVLSMDGNMMLMNLKNIKRENVGMVSEIKGFHIYDFLLCYQCYKKGLVCAVDSNLFVLHTSTGNQKAFDKFLKSDEFKSFYISEFNNESIATMNGIIETAKIGIEPDKNKNDYYSVIYKAVENAYKNKKRNLNIIIRVWGGTHIGSLRRNLESIRDRYNNNKSLEIVTYISVNNADKSKLEEFKSIADEFKDINCKVTYIAKDEMGKQYPRVATMKKTMEIIDENENSFAIFIDCDDYIGEQNIFGKLNLVLQNGIIILGDTKVYEEKWEGENIDSDNAKELRRFTPFDYYKNVFGANYVPFPSAIYPVNILKKIFSENELLGDYMEDFALLTHALSLTKAEYYPILFAKVSYHGSNTVLETNRRHWDYSEASFFSEIVNNGVISKFHFDLANQFGVKGLSIDRFPEMISKYYEFKSFQGGIIWKTLKLYRRIKGKIKVTLMKALGKSDE